MEFLIRFTHFTAQLHTVLYLYSVHGTLANLKHFSKKSTELHLKIFTEGLANFQGRFFKILLRHSFVFELYFLVRNG